MINIIEGYEVMQPLIDRALRHAFYDHTVARKKLYHAMLTGQSIEDYLTRFEMRESVEQFDARKTVTQQCVTPAVNEAVGYFQKTSRYPNIKKDISYENEDLAKLERLKAALRDFCYEGDVQTFLAMEYDRRSLIDPNAFLVMDFKGFDETAGEVPKVYGVFVPCEDVVDYDYLPNDELNYLIIVKHVVVYDKDNNPHQLTDYVGYLGDDVLIFEEVSEHRVMSLNPSETIFRLNSKDYYAYEYSSKAGRVQAYRLGYMKDPDTHYRTCVSPLDVAETVVMDLNNDKSEYDQTKRFHVFPQKLQYASPCKGLSDVVTCNHGYTPNGRACEVCHGTGLRVHLSSSDIITLPMPTDEEDYVVKLQDMIHYVKPDVEIIKHLREDVDAGRLNIIRAIFTTESAKKTDGTVKVEETATKTNLTSDDKNNTLLPFCEYKSRFFKFIVIQTATFHDLQEGLRVLFEYPQSLKLETVEELQAKYAELVKAGTSPILLAGIEQEIAAKQFLDDPEGLKRYETLQVHRPFRNRTPDEIEFCIGQGSVPKWLQVLWSNYEYIMTTIEYANKGFYDMEYTQQATIVKTAAEALVKDLEPEPITGFLGTGKKQPIEDQAA